MSITLENALVFIPHRPNAITYGMSQGWNDEPRIMIASGRTYVFNPDERAVLSKVLIASGANRRVVQDYLRPLQPIAELPGLTHYLSMVMLSSGYQAGVDLPYHQPQTLKNMANTIEKNNSILSDMIAQTIYSITFIFDKTVKDYSSSSMYIKPTSLSSLETI